MATEEFSSVYRMSPEQTQQRLEEIERNYREFFASAGDGFYISTREGHFIDCNDALVRMLGYRCTEDVLQLDLNTSLWEYLDDRRHFQQIIEEYGLVKDYKATWRKNDGSLINVSLSSQVWTDHSGEVRGYRGFVVDLTEEYMMRAQLIASETKYRDLFENIQDGLYISDSSGRVVDCNQALCDIIGYGRSEFINMDYYQDLFTDPSKALDFRRKLTREGVVKDYELELRKRDGSVILVSMSGYAGLNSKGKVISYHGMMRDITETNRLQRQLLQSERLSAMGKMTSQLAHELNNPIYGIMNCLELIKDAVPTAHQRRKYLDLAYEECKRTSALLRKMLNFFKPDDEKLVEVDINRVLEETLLFYERQFKNLNISVKSDLTADLPGLTGVESQLKQVFINMIINAIAAMPEGGALSVSSSLDEDRDMIAIKIADTGIGIPKGNLDRVFDAFFTTKQEMRGVGLGLSICYGFIRDLGGEIVVESEEGCGTTFTIRLPREHRGTA